MTCWEGQLGDNRQINWEKRPEEDLEINALMECLHGIIKTRTLIWSMTPVIVLNAKLSPPMLIYTAHGDNDPFQCNLLLVHRLVLYWYRDTRRFLFFRKWPLSTKVSPVGLTTLSWVRVHSVHEAGCLSPLVQKFQSIAGSYQIFFFRPIHLQRVPQVRLAVAIRYGSFDNCLRRFFTETDRGL